METKAKLRITIDKDLEDIVPGYLENREKDVILLPQAIRENNFDSLKMIGHRMKGSGAGYGFQQISDIGNSIEQAAAIQDLATIRDCLDQLIDYLGKIEVVYE
ncbi:MAG: Hpt domain-containing protein [Nitrospirae bacterium]|nr:Hpt domain-containing protein [Magnetococcales bacterium]HAT49210.1 Hpt domain-containing protein [Alphaproteobacteria bacterium]